MAQPATSPKIEELRFRLKTDPKSRLFYPLAEELRKAGHVTEAEQVLRGGLEVHATYLSAWVSLGRVLRDQKKDSEAVDVLTRALQLDPGNVVAARLLADAYLALGDKLEAIKKYKLVYALMPADESLQATIAQLDRDLAPPLPIAPAPEPEAEPEPEPLATNSIEETVETPSPAAASAPIEEESPFDRTMPPFEEAARAFAEEQRTGVETGDFEPMARAHDDSPFEEPVDGFTGATMSIEAPLGMHIAAAPLAAEVPAPVTFEEDLPQVESAVIAPEPPTEEADVFEPADPVPTREAEHVVNTITMADLYARQGLLDDARHIYETILARDPANESVRAKLQALHAPAAEPAPVLEAANPKIERLERWLAKVSRREVNGV
ncbi:MAG: tetratricopeptide repeat protein [Acidobacteria bacterium]|nr:tetratricopeptide repeat protein [Acidobacteriota bacterium]MBV9477796.1 tetratricopeptide repeat protein [Acidobacteriota bacterium]